MGPYHWMHFLGFGHCLLYVCACSKQQQCSNPLWGSFQHVESIFRKAELVFSSESFPWLWAMLVACISAAPPIPLHLYGAGGVGYAPFPVWYTTAGLIMLD